MESDKLTEEFVEEYYVRSRAKFDEALNVSGEYKRFYRIAETTVCLHFAGNTLVPLLCPALAHLEIAPVTKPDFTVKIWESKTTGVKMLPPPCPQKNFTHRGDIYGAPTNTILMAYHSPEAAFNLFHKERKEAIHWVQNPEKFHYWVTSSPLRSIFGWWMEQNQGQLLHAAAVGTKNGAVLISGRGGLGKSSTAVKGLNAGMLYLADDYLIIRNNPEPRVYSLYSTAKIHRQELALYPKLKPALAPFINAGQEKGVYFLHKHFEKQIVTSLPLRAILTPQVAQGRRESQLETVEGYEVLQAMAFTTTTQIPHTGAYTQQFLKNLVNTFPAGRVKLGEDAKRLTELLTSICNKPQETFQKIGKAKVAPEWPLISVIIPTYSRAHFIKEAVNNVLSQKYPALELIIVDDGSTDNTEEVVKGLNVDVHYLKQANKGPAAARNMGIKNANGSLIAFLDVDDHWSEGNLLRLAKILNQNAATHIARGYAQLFKKNELGAKEHLGSPRESFLNYIGACLYRKEVFTIVGSFDEDLKFAEDDDWFIRAQEAELEIERTPEVSLFVLRHEENMTDDKANLVPTRLKLFQKKLFRHKTFSNSKELMYRPNYEFPDYKALPISIIINADDFSRKGLENYLTHFTKIYEALEIIIRGEQPVLDGLSISEKYKSLVKTNSYSLDMNRAIELATSKYVYFPAPHCVLYDLGLKKLVNTLEKREDLNFVLGYAQKENERLKKPFLDSALVLFQKPLLQKFSLKKAVDKREAWFNFFVKLQAEGYIFGFVKSGVTLTYSAVQDESEAFSKAHISKNELSRPSRGSFLQGQALLNFLETGVL